MSAPDVRLIISARARNDIRSIFQYTSRQWGRDQAITYDAALDKAFALLQENPLLGRKRDDLRQGLRGLPVEQHVILYRFDDDVIVVQRVIHMRRDIRRELDRP